MAAAQEGEGDGEQQPQQQRGAADARRDRGPAAAQQLEPEPLLQLTDAFGFHLEVTVEQAAILGRCAAHGARQQAKWAPLAHAGGSEAAPADALKKLCRKVGRAGASGEAGMWCSQLQGGGCMPGWRSRLH